MRRPSSRGVQDAITKRPRKPTGRNEPSFTVVPPFVGQRHHAAGEDQFGLGEIEAAFGASRSALGFVPGIHGTMYPQGPWGQKMPGGSEKRRLRSWGRKSATDEFVDPAQSGAQSERLKSWIPACEGVIKSHRGWINALRPSRPRCARRLRMRNFNNAIKSLPHVEEPPPGSALCAARGQAPAGSRSTHVALAALVIRSQPIG